MKRVTALTLLVSAFSLLVAPLALSCRNDVFSDTVTRPQPTHIAWGLVLFALVVAIAWRLVLSPPLAFG